MRRQWSRRRAWPRSRRQKRRLWLLWVAAVVALSVLWLDRAVRPALIAIADVRCKVLATQAVNAAICEEVVDGVQYRDLVTVETDGSGQVTYMQSDVVKINLMASRAQSVVLRELEKLRQEKIRIPLGQLAGSMLFANVGPRVPVTIAPVGTCSVNVEEDFSAVGINQVKHTLYITVKAELRVVVPLFNHPIEVTTKAPVADVIIVGRVPATYIRLGGQ